jgi:uncharacterized protein (DUF58 family)
VTPTARTAIVVGAVALSALFLPLPLAIVALLGVLAAAAVDALAVRRSPEVERRLPATLSRGVRATLTVDVEQPPAGRVRVRQPVPPDLRLEPQEAEERLAAELVARRRGRHVVPRPATRTVGPLGLGAWHHRPGEEAEVLVYPDLPAAFRLALAVRQGRFAETGRLTRGPLGLGTDFESIRDYLPDDDIRQVNWTASARVGRPMSNQYRVEQDRDVVCAVDAGRLMAAPLGDRTRLDAAVDAVAAVAAVADELGDRCGLVAFDSEVRRRVAPRRRGARAVLRALYDLEPRPVESDYELAFRTVGGGKRSLVIVLTDLLEETAARPLVEAMPVLRARHAVAVASSSDPDLEDAVQTDPDGPADVYAAAVAVEVLDARARAAARLSAAGATVVEAPPERLGAACVSAYLRAKARARL